MKKQENKVTRKKDYDKNRDSYVDKDGNYIYIRQELTDDGRYRCVKEVIKCDDKNREIIEHLMKFDHDEYLQNHYQKINEDWLFHNRKEDEEVDEVCIPDNMDLIPDKHGDAFDILAGERDEDKLEFSKKYLVFLGKLTLLDKELLRLHIDEKLSIQEICNQFNSKGEDYKVDYLESRWRRAKKIAKEIYSLQQN